MFRTILITLLFCSLSICAQSNKAELDLASVNLTISRYLKSVEAKDFNKARQNFTSVDGKLQDISEKELISFAKTLNQFIKNPQLKAQQTTPGLFTLSYVGLSFSMIKDIDSNWHFTALTRRNISALQEKLQRFSSPEKTMQHYLETISNKSYKAARHCFAPPMEGSDIAQFNESLSVDKLSNFAEIIQRVIKTKTPAVREGALVSYNFNGDQKLYLFRTINEEWLFTPETRRNLSEIYDLMQQSDADRFVPDSLRSKFFLLENWQWLGIFAIVLLGFLIQAFINFLLGKQLMQRFYRNKPSSKKINRKSSSVNLLSHSTCWHLLLPYLKLNSELKTALEKGTLITMLIGALLTIGLIFDLIKDILVEKSKETETKADDVLVPMFHKVAKIILYAFGFIFIASNIGVDVAGLIAGLGIGGLAFALAAQDTVKNVFGSITVLLDKPFQVGDWIAVDGYDGTVEKIGLRSTAIRTFYNSLVNVPNANLISAVVDNYGRREYRRIRTMLSLTYDTPPAKIEAFCEGVRELIRQHPYTRKDYYHVYLNQFSAASLDVLLYCFIKCPDWSIELRERQRLFLDIIRLANRLEVEFAFPTQTLHIAKPEDLQAAELETSVADIEKLYQQGRQTGNSVYQQSLGTEEARVAKEVNYVKGNNFAS